MCVPENDLGCIIGPAVYFLFPFLRLEGLLTFIYIKGNHCYKLYHQVNLYLMAGWSSALTIRRRQLYLYVRVRVGVRW